LGTPVIECKCNGLLKGRFGYCRRYGRVSVMRKQFYMFSLMMMALILATGCLDFGIRGGSSQASTTTLSSAAVSSQTTSGSETATDTPTTAETTTAATATESKPSPSPSPTASPAPSPTAKPTAKPTARPTPTPSDEGKVVLAEGFYYTKLSSALIKKITGMSYPAPGEPCVITYDDLRDIRLLHYDFSGVVHEGELMVNAKLADEVMEIFHELYLAKYPLTSVHLVDDYGQPHIDGLSMAANNTSGFCYRYVTGTTSLSRHSYGAAIDVNPQLNPYINGDRISPSNGAPYVDRTQDFPGKIDHDDLCYQLFIAHGWEWGGDWTGDKDYQHFSKNIK
jgi:hypothetical protein